VTERPGVEREYRDAVPVESIHTHPRNVRLDLGDLSELVQSIKEVGVLQPLTVAPCGTHCDGFVPIIGNRRHAASVRAGLPTVPAIVLIGLTEEQVYQDMLIENLHRAPLKPMEEAVALKGLHDSGLTQQQIADRIGKSIAFVNHRLVLNELPYEVAVKLNRDEIGISEAVRLARLLAGRSPEKVDRGWDKPHFSDAHPLAKLAKALCRSHEHRLRRRIGGSACGECWEQVIRDDADWPDEATPAPAPVPRAEPLPEPDPLELPDALALLNLFAGCHLNVQTATPLRVRKAIERATERIRDDLDGWQRQQDRQRPDLATIQDEAATGRVRHDTTRPDVDEYDDTREVEGATA
jgi:ParB family chromosome partitioning protein